MIIRASMLQRASVAHLLGEYYDAIGIQERDGPAELAGYLSDADSGLWLAYAGGTPAGCVILRPLPAVPFAGECKRLYVRPLFRGRGLAGALLDSLEAHAARLSLQWVYLDSHEELKDAGRIYARRGYGTCARYNDNPQATVFLRKRLLPGEAR